MMTTDEFADKMVAQWKLDDLHRDIRLNKSTASSHLYLMGGLSIGALLLGLASSTISAVVVWVWLVLIYKENVTTMRRIRCDSEALVIAQLSS